MDVPSIKNNLISGVMDFDKSKYVWKSDLPVPEESIYLRFKYKRTKEKKHQSFLYNKKQYYNSIEFSIRFYDEMVFVVNNNREDTYYP